MNGESHPISGLVESALKNLRSLVDADTVIGQPITTQDGTVIIPVSKVSFGFAAGGTDIPTSKGGEPFGGGNGGGVSVQPIAFLVISGGHVELLQINDNRNTADRVVSLVPELIDKLTALIKQERQEKQKDAGGSGDKTEEKPGN